MKKQIDKLFKCQLCGEVFSFPDKFKEVDKDNIVVFENEKTIHKCSNKLSTDNRTGIAVFVGINEGLIK